MPHLLGEVFEILTLLDPDAYVAVPKILEMRALDLNIVLRDMDKMLHRLMGEDIELIAVLANDLGRVKTNQVWIESS